MMKSNNTSVKTAYVIDSSVAIRNGQYGKWEYSKSEAPRFVPMGAAVYLKSICMDADPLESTFELSFVDAQEKEVHLVLERKNLSEQGVLSLLPQGVQVTKKTASTLVTSLMNQEPTVPCEIRHKELGFRMFEEKRVFFGGKGVNVESIYCGNLLIKPTGSFDAWKEMVQTEVLGTNLETIVAIAAAAPVIDFLKEEIHTGTINPVGLLLPKEFRIAITVVGII